MTLISSNNKRYLSQIPEFKEGLPHGVLNKKLTDVGGTLAALKATSNYIIVCPFTDLVDSITNDKNSPYPVFGKYKNLGSVASFKEYIKSSKYIKIAVTYDSFPIIINMIERYSDISTFKVLVDEYHLILEDLGFREKAILQLLSNIKKFSHYTFMSATPMSSQFIPEFISDLPYTEVDWGATMQIFPTRLKTQNVYRTTSKLIKEFLDTGIYLTVDNKNTKVEELYIFLNSVQGIKQICDTIKLSPDDVKIVCADKIRNSQTLTNYTINKVTDKSKPINFFTKKGFQGCNLFTNNGLIIVVSDANKKQTLVDIETTMFQISGRLRTNKDYHNIFKDRIWHIYSTKKQETTDGEDLLEEAKRETEILINIYKRLTDPEEKKVYLKRNDIENLMCYIEGDEYIYSELKENYLRYINKLKNHVYKNGLSIGKEYKRLNILAEKELCADVNKDDIILAKMNTVSFKELLKQYIALKEQGDDLVASYEEEFPLFKEAYTKLGVGKLGTLGYSETKITNAIKELSGIELAFKQLFNKIDNGFISSKDLKTLISNIYKDKNINKAAKASDIEDSSLFKAKKMDKKIDGKTVRGYEIIKNNFICYTY